MSDATLTDYLRSSQQKVNTRLEYWLEQQAQLAPRLVEAMAYATFNGGKRVRPVLAFATAEALGGSADHAVDAACALEMVHSYSLVHDDLPAMDDDDLRRGEPTCHIAFDEATAILAGDALQCLAFEVLANSPLAAMSSPVKIQMIQELAKSSGTAGMAGGQALDLEGEDKQLTLAELERIHRHKTGQLIRGAVRMGAMVAPPCTDDQLRALDQYAETIGLAFQVWDDVLDVIGDTETLGKQQGADLALNKSTYPQLLGLDAAKAYAQSLDEKAQAALSHFDHKADTLRALSRYIVSRSH
ncbi:MAG: (2E,6E)-farnesyl diphosphate synthase [Gammaproteobacteria bacterium]|nr:MAG: (2E,6E)-farnesyl diphosphate synthase [Gammaproteobacteria bacterium]